MTQRDSENELDWLSAILWNGATASSNSRYAVLPSAARPRFLVPLEWPRASSYALKSYSTSRRIGRIGRHALALGFRIGLSKRILSERAGPAIGDEDDALIETQLRRIVGQPVVSSIFFQTGRPQKKPVLQLITAQGVSLAFAKVGWNDLTRGLIRTEAAALRDVQAARLDEGELTTARVLHEGEWHENHILLVEALTGLKPGPVSVFPRGATRALAALSTGDRRAFNDSPYWALQQTRVTRSSTPSLRSAADLVDRIGEIDCEFGRIHGDWVPWNMAVRRTGGLAVWDWEWSRSDGPAGLDAVQWLFQRALHLDHLSPAAAVDRTLREAPSELAKLGVDGRLARPLLGAHIVESILRLQEARAAHVGRVIGTDRYDRAIERLLDAP